MVDDTSRPPAGAAPQQVADLLRTFDGAASDERRRRRPREDAPDTIVPLLVVPEETPLDPSRIEAARARLKLKAAEAAATAADPAPGAADVDPAAFDAARSRLRTRRSRPVSPPQT